MSMHADYDEQLCLDAGRSGFIDCAHCGEPVPEERAFLRGREYVCSNCNDQWEGIQ